MLYTNLKKIFKEGKDMATLKDVAERAGVSASLVSYVLNGKRKVKPETLKKIENAIEELDYYPNLQAASLKTKHSKLIGVVVSDMSSAFNADLLTGIEEALNFQGYCMIVCNSHNSPQKEKKSMRRILSQNIDGILLIGMGKNDFSILRGMNVPIVCVDRYSGGDFYMVGNDNTKTGTIAARYLLSKKYKRILLLGIQKHRFSRERCQGFVETMKTAVPMPDIIYRDLPDITPDEAEKTVTALLSKGIHFDAVYGCIDHFAIGALRALYQKGLKVPEQIGVLGTDDITPARYLTPALSTIAQQKTIIGKTAAETLLQLIRREKPKEKVCLLDPILVVRETC